jgi:hypothetical protein
MRERRDGLHLDRVALLERVIENAGRIDHLPTQIFVVGVADQQRLCRERVRLHVDVGARNFVQKRTLRAASNFTKRRGEGVIIYSVATLVVFGW